MNECKQCEWIKNGAGHSKNLHTCRPSCAVTLFVQGAGEFPCNNKLPCSKHPHANAIPQDSEMCERCGKVDKLENMHLKGETILCDGCNSGITARVEAQGEDLEKDTI